MANNFFEKLKRGMNIEDIAEPEKEKLEIEKEAKEEVKETTEEASKEDIEKNYEEKEAEEEKSNPKPEEETDNNPEIEAEFQVIGAEDINLKIPEKSKEIVLTSKKATKKRKSKKETNNKNQKISNKKNDFQKEKIEIKKESILNRDEAEEETAIFEKQGQLTIDVFETNKNIVIQSAVGGVNPEDLEIIIEKDMVCIKGKRKRCEEEETEKFFFQECYWGKFSREIILPVLVDSSKSQASLENGILTIKIPKTEKQDNSQKINIKSL